MKSGHEKIRIVTIRAGIIRYMTIRWMIFWSESKFAAWFCG